MKTFFFTFITFMLVAMQSFAGSNDSITSIISGREPVGDPNFLTLVGGENSLVNGDEVPIEVDPDGSIDFTDNIVSADGSSMATASCTTDGAQALGSSRVFTFTFKTYSTHTPAQLVDNTGMFSMTKTKVNSGRERVCVIVGGVFPFQYVWRDYTTWKIKVTYRPTRYGTHTAKLYLYVGKLDNLNILLYKYSYTLTGVASRGSVYSNNHVEGESDEFGTNEWTNLEMTSDVQNNYITTDVSELAMDVKIYAEGQDIVIETPVEQNAIVSDIAGHARRVNLQAGRNVIPAGGNGVHIVRVGEKSAKLMLR